MIRRTRTTRHKTLKNLKPTHKLQNKMNNLDSTEKLERKYVNYPQKKIIIIKEKES